MTVAALQAFVIQTETALAMANAQHEAVLADFNARQTDDALWALRITGNAVAGLAGELIAARAALRAEVDARAELRVA